MSRSVEVLILLAVCGVAFFTGLGRHDYIKTEGLRAVVVDEMLERDGLTMPTVHGSPYLKKPPLYAWTTTLLARAVGRFDEQIARLPSAICGTLLVLLIYGLGERWIGRGAGFCAAVMLLWCPTIVDYAVRAELDLPFSFFTIAAVACTLCALTPKVEAAPPMIRTRNGEPNPTPKGSRAVAAGEANTGAAGEGQPVVNHRHETQQPRRGVGNHLLQMTDALPISPPGWAWPAAYFFALIASLWKGPHSLIFMWLVMIGHGLATRRWAFLRSPSQWISVAIVLGVLIGWTKALSDFAGPSTVGRTAAIELIARLLPHEPLHILFIVTFPLELAAMTLIPAAFASFSLHPEARHAVGLDIGRPPPTGSMIHRTKSICRDWWTALTGNPNFLRIAVWFLPLLVFMAIAPAKAARYSIPIFPPIVLLAAAICTRLQDDSTNEHITRAYHRVWRIIFIVIGAVGIAAALVWAIRMTVPNIRFPESDWGFRWLILAAGCGAVAYTELFRGRSSLNCRLLSLLVVLLVAQPVLKFELWPRREAADSQRAAASQLDQAVPSGETIFVLGKHEYPDTQIYSTREFRFTDSVDAALDDAGGDRAFCIVRIDALEDLESTVRAQYREVLRFLRADKVNLLIEVTPK